MANSGHVFFSIDKKNCRLAFHIPPHSPTFAVLSQNNGCGDLLLRIENVRFSGYHFKKREKRLKQ